MWTLLTSKAASARAPRNPLGTVSARYFLALPQHPHAALAVYELDEAKWLAGRSP